MASRSKICQSIRTFGIVTPDERPPAMTRKGHISAHEELVTHAGFATTHPVREFALCLGCPPRCVCTCKATIAGVPGAGVTGFFAIAASRLACWSPPACASTRAVEGTDGSSGVIDRLRRVPATAPRPEPVCPGGGKSGRRTLADDLGKRCDRLRARALVYEGICSGASVSACRGWVMGPAVDRPPAEPR